MHQFYVCFIFIDLLVLYILLKYYWYYYYDFIPAINLNVDFFYSA